MISRIGPGEIAKSVLCKGWNQHRKTVMRTIQICLRDGIGGFLRGLLIFVFMVSRMGSLNLPGIMRAIFRHRRKRRLQRKDAKQNHEQKALHFGRKSSIQVAWVDKD